MSRNFSPIQWDESGRVVMLDQTLVPREETYRVYETGEQVAEAIRSMVIRGAPAIGIAAAMGLALGAARFKTTDVDQFRTEFEQLCGLMAETRPTAVNLFWAIERMRGVLERSSSEGVVGIISALRRESEQIHREDVECNKQIGEHGRVLFSEGDTILTHCNTGSLATGGYGTALGVIRAAVDSGLNVRVFANETRPFLQGSRLTAWELMRDEIDVTLITDSMAGHFMQRGAVDAVIVGADRIAANGDTANKIGTYTMAVLAKFHNIPFYVAAPTSTIDLQLAGGAEIPIEERSPLEVRECFGVATAPTEVPVHNPAFDVTPSRLIDTIITERGLARAPYIESLLALFTTK